MKKYLPIVICLSSLLLSSPVLAETKIFIKEYTYQASEFDSKASSRILALEQVKRLLLEELGTYLESNTEVKNYQLTKDQIVILTAGIVSAEIVDERWDGKTYSLKAKITADPKDVATSIERLHHDRQRTKELEETRKKANEALREVERLKKELEIAKAGKAEQDQYTKAVNGLSATDWFEKGYALGLSGKFQDAIGAYSKAIELDPDNANTYYNRGTQYGRRLGNYSMAIEDFNRAVELNPKFVEAYNNRAAAYYVLGDYQKAIRDYDKVIGLEPKNALAYRYRGNAYAKIGDRRQALEDQKNAARLGDKQLQDLLRREGIAW